VNPRGARLRGRRLAFLGLVASVVLLAGRDPAVSAAAPERTDDLTPPPLRIPEGSRPMRYEVTLTVVPGEPAARGEIVIFLELARPHRVLWLNADELAVSRATVSAPATAVTILPHADQFIGLAFQPPLPAGKHRLTLGFEAAQTRNSTRGIFALEDRGAWYAMTQFEAFLETH